MIRLLFLLLILPIQLHANDLILQKFPSEFKIKTEIIDDDVELTGYFIQGGLIMGKAPIEKSIRIGKGSVKTEIQRFYNGHFIIGFHHEEERSVTISIDNARDYNLNIEKRNYQTQRINNLDKKFVQPSAETFQRIKREVKLAKEKRMTRSNWQFARQNFIQPVSDGIITGIYGSKRILNGQPRQPHYGYDIAAPKGTEIIAPQGGKVILVEDLYYSGVTIMLDHGHGLISSFLHLDKSLVADGQMVKQGDVIGHIGSTGRSTGAHLDWRVNWYDRRVDAAVLLALANNNK